MPEPLDMKDVMADAVQAASLAYPGDIVTRWVAMVETLDSNGERALITGCQSGMKLWDALGMLTFAVQMEQTGLVTNVD